MRQITVKYQGECKKCGATLEIGQAATYERLTGIFCVGCEPTDPEEIRAYRQERADRKADRLDAWAEKREVKAEAALNSYPEIRHDWAFITQPGRIPFRDRMNRADARAVESLKVAEGMRERAASLRHVRVAGDAERKREARRELLRPLLKVGQRISTPMWGTGTIIKINRLTVKMAIDRLGGKAYNEPIEWVSILADAQIEAGS